MTSRKDRFLWKNGDIEISQCVKCANYHSFGKCLAFPSGILGMILSNERDHTKPVEGDNGIQFEPVKQ